MDPKKEAIVAFGLGFLLIGVASVKHNKHATLMDSIGSTVNVLNGVTGVISNIGGM
jgi:hypothetical protein